MHRKKRRFFKVFKVAGKIFITTVSKKKVQKKSDEGPWWISPTKSSTIRWLIQAYEWSKCPLDDAVESHRSGILFYWKLKKLERYEVDSLYFAPLQFPRLKWSCSSFNIQYQSTGVGSLPSTDEIELIQIVWGVFSRKHDTFWWTCL